MFIVRAQVRDDEGGGSRVWCKRNGGSEETKEHLNLLDMGNPLSFPYYPALILTTGTSQQTSKNLVAVTVVCNQRVSAFNSVLHYVINNIT